MHYRSRGTLTLPNRGKIWQQKDSAKRTIRGDATRKYEREGEIDTTRNDDDDGDDNGNGNSMIAVCFM